MAEVRAQRNGAADGAIASARRAPRRLPAVVRYAIIVALGAAIAGLATYLLRTIGF